MYYNSQDLYKAKHGMTWNYVDKYVFSIKCWSVEQNKYISSSQGMLETTYVARLSIMEGSLWTDWTVSKRENIPGWNCQTGLLSNWAVFQLEE